MVIGAEPKAISAHITRFSRSDERMGEINIGKDIEEKDSFTTTVLIMDYINKNRFGYKSLSDYLLILRDNTDTLVDMVSYLNSTPEIGKKERLSGVNKALSMVEFCCKQIKRKNGSSNDEMVMFNEYCMMLFEGMRPSVVETLLTLEIDCDLRAMKEAAHSPPKNPTS
ncbi:MAG: hypothetical protein V1909_02500 [Candidatus Micrarchaeota archaeon]